MSSGIEERDTKGNWKINLLESNCAVLCDQFVYFLCSIPLESIENSAVGDAPKNIWQQLSGVIGGAIKSAVNFIKNAVIAVANFINYAKEVIAKEALSLYSTAVSTVKSAVAVVKKAVDAAVAWVKEEMNNIFSGIKNAVEDMQKKLSDVYKEFIMAVYENDKQREAMEFIKMFACIGAVAASIYGLYWGLAIAVNANPLIGVIITGVVTVAFMAVFYSLYPKEYRETGEGIISVGDLLLKPADELYDFDKQYCGSIGFFFSTVVASIGASWSGAITNSPAETFITLALTIATLLAMLPVLYTDYHDTAVKKTIAVGLLGIASYALVSTTTAGWRSLSSSSSLGGFLVKALFWAMFELISAYSVLTLIGFLHTGV